MEDLCRNSQTVPIEVGTSAANSEAIPYFDFAGGLIHVPSTEATQTLSFYANTTEGNDPSVLTFQQVASYDGTLITVATVADTSYEISPSLFSAQWLKIVADAISGGTSITYTVTLKS